MSNAVNPNPQPFVYPPVTLPLFELLARLPVSLVQAVWTISGIVATLQKPGTSAYTPSGNRSAMSSPLPETDSGSSPR